MKPSTVAEELMVEADAGTTVLKVTRQVSAKIGIDCFRAMVTHLAQALKADCVFIGEFTPGRVQRVMTLAASLEGEPTRLTFDLAGIACSSIAGIGQPFVCRENDRHRCPSAQLLSRLSAEACI